MKNRYNGTVTACFVAYVVQAIVNNFAPLLFLTFQRGYGIPLSKITLLVTLNFGVQLLVDLLFSFRPQYFDIPRVVRYAPLLAAAGLYDVSSKQLLDASKTQQILLATLRNE